MLTIFLLTILAFNGRRLRQSKLPNADKWLALVGAINRQP